jgi:tRNA G18 (ribose-2'-O)-methylase SpoU
VVEAARLHRAEERRRRHLTLLEGPHLVAEALAAGVPLAAVFVADAERAGEWGAVVEVTPEALARLSSTRSPQSPVAVMEIPHHHLDPSRSLLVAWGISDPGNLGTMIRTAAAFDLDVAITSESADPWSPKVLRSAMGGHFHTNVVVVQGLEGIAATTVAAVVSGGSPPGSIPPGRVAILVGSEAAGLPPAVSREAGHRVTIPLAEGVESLNAATAAAILAYEARRRPAANSD